MKYIINTIADLIVNNAPSNDGEMMIRVDGFENIRIYEAIARQISKELLDKGLTVKIKLARNKWNYFKEKSDAITCMNSMEQHGWVAEEDSITYYRNLHDTNVLVLFGTENEEDKGGLMNFYTITPDTLVKELSGSYYDIFVDALDFAQLDIQIVNKLYKDLFEYVAIDICKLSDLVDSWFNRISTISDFVELFYETLPQWGLPYKKANLPKTRDLNSKKNILQMEYNFISRQLFKSISKPQYNKYKKQLEQYQETEVEYSSSWDGWCQQGINNYDEFAEVVMGYIRGENVAEYKKKLIQTDFSIIEAVLSLKIKNPDKVTQKTPTVSNVLGEPLEAFLDALLQMLNRVAENDNEVVCFDFDMKQAEVVSVYSDVEGEEEKQQLQKTWTNICWHVNGIFDYINQKSWLINGHGIKIKCSPENFFDPKCALVNIESGFVIAANANKKVSKIDFTVKCSDEHGNIIKEDKKDFAQMFQWKFCGTDLWLHNFTDICTIVEENPQYESYIPIAIINKMTPLLFAKSEEEFLDAYEESDIKFDVNLSQLVQEKVLDETHWLAERFDELGNQFVKFIKKVKNEGFYACIWKEQSELSELIKLYETLGDFLVRETFPENQKWILDAYIHAFNIEENKNVVLSGADARCCVVPAWHPAALEKLDEQKRFFLNGCSEWWDEKNYGTTVRQKSLDAMLENLNQMSLMKSSLDIFPSFGQQYFGATNSFGAFSVYGRSDIKNNSRLKDMIHKDAIYDDDFDGKENVKMNDNAKMLYGVLADYIKAFPNAYRNLSIVFIDPSELQPIIASVYRYVEVVKKYHPNEKINICIKILVKPENKGGKNYLAYWMDECFSQDNNVSIKTYLNEWKSESDIDKLLNSNNDIVFVMDLLKINNLQFVIENSATKWELSQCRFPIVFKPSPVSDTSNNVKRRIELSQPQFKSSYIHTQVVRYRNNSETLPVGNFIAVREVGIDENSKSIVRALHEKAYWVVCVDSGMDGALLRSDENQKSEYSIIGFSTGKGTFGQYNLTITARKSILDSIRKKFECRLYQLFRWEKEKIDKAAELCLREASGLDGISLLSAINQKDYNINEFMAYVLTSLREKEIEKQREQKSALKIVIHLDSYKHWFGSDIENEEESKSRPDFLVLEANVSDDNKLQLKATVTECKISSSHNAEGHKEKAVGQVKHGMGRLATIFDPMSSSIHRRYWYAQLYRALAFAQVTFSDNSEEFAKLSTKLRSVLDGNFNIEWNGRVLGYWLDMDGEDESITGSDLLGVEVYDIPQKKIQKLLLDEDVDEMKFVNINSELLLDEENEKQKIEEREKEIDEALKKIQRKRKKASSNSNEKKRTVSEMEVDTEQTTVINNEKIENVVHISEDVVHIQTNEVVKEQEQYGNVEIFAENVAESPDFSVKQDSENILYDNLDEMRVLIGTDKMGENVYWEFGHKQLANRHMLITGTSGQGKTYSIQTMLYELSKSNVSSVIFDYTEGFRLDQLEKEFLDKMGSKVSQHIVKVQGVPINPFKQHELEIAGIKILENAADVAARFANILIHVYGFGDQQFSAIFEATRIGIEKYGNDMDMRHFQDELEEIKSKNKAAQTVLSKMAPFFWSITFNQNEEFDWGDVLYSPEAVTKIFQLTSIDREMQVIVTELMLWDAWYYTKKYGSKEKPFVVVLDEAQNLSHKSNSPSAAILTEGRKFGWSAWFATQSLKVLADDEVVRLLQAACKLYFKPTDDEVVKMSKQLDPTDGSIWLNALKALKKGQCIVVGERKKADGRFGLVKPTITSVMPFDGRE